MAVVHDVRMEPDWTRLGGVVARARAALGYTQVSLAAAADVKRSAIQAIERGQKFTKITGTLRTIEGLLGWQRGSIELILEGGDPIPASSVDAQSEPEHAGIYSPTITAENLPAKVVTSMNADGPILDATVLNLSRPGSRTKLILVVKGAPDATPDEIRADLLAWEAQQLALEETDTTRSGEESDGQGA